MTNKKMGWRSAPAGTSSRQNAAIWLAGRPGWSSMRPDAAELGRRIRAATWQAANRTPAVGAAKDRRVLALVRAQHPRALDVVPSEAIVALLAAPAPGRCNWDRFRDLMAKAGKTLSSPPPPGLRAALGSMCSRCRVAFEAVLVAEREAAHQAELTAAGFRPAAAAHIRPGRVQAAKAALQAAANAPTPPSAPTGAIWPSSQRRRGSSPKTPLPSYYIPNRRPRR